MQTIALFGGSFDPPHIAHETIVTKLLKLDTIDKVVVMPTFLSPFKSTSHVPAKQRLKWLQKIFLSQENVEVSSYEVDLSRSVATIESVQYLLKKYAKVYLVIGADNLASLGTWYKYEELCSSVEFIVVSRDGIKIPQKYLHLAVKEDISSTQLRGKLDKAKLPKLCAQEIIQFYKENI